MKHVSHRSAGGRKQVRDAIIVPGINAWQSAQSEKLAFLVDAADYYRRLEDVFRRARKTIWIIGWDFNADIYLRPDRPSQTLGELLRAAVDENEKLEVRILVWSMGPIYSGKSLSLFTENTWSNHPRIHLRFDTKHPLRGSHHQKVVVVDDCLAFIGGIDLTARRWDTPEHLADNPLRVAPDGNPYEPVHDLQAAFSGAAASMIGDLARRRWRRATGETIPKQEGTETLWWDDLSADMSGCHIGLALTEPGYAGRRERREAMRLTLDALSAARRHIYIESQYFAFFGLAHIIEQHLQSPDGPEIVTIVTRASHGLVEKIMMGYNRDRLIRRLKRADRYNRLRVMYPVVPDGEDGEQDVLIHSKLLIIDDRFLRLGSSNLNNRSEGLDTEADIAVEAKAEDCSRAIVSLRDRLIAEHLDARPEAVALRIAATGSMIEAIDALNIHPRGLRDMDVGSGETAPVWGTGLVDPRKPLWPLQKVRTGFETITSRFLGIFL